MTFSKTFLPSVRYRMVTSLSLKILWCHHRHHGASGSSGVRVGSGKTQCVLFKKEEQRRNTCPSEKGYLSILPAHPFTGQQVWIKVQEFIHLLLGGCHSSWKWWPHSTALPSSTLSHLPAKMVPDAAAMEARFRLLDLSDTICLAVNQSRF